MKYKVGDKVVIRKPKYKDASWIKEMNKYVGKTVTITVTHLAANKEYYYIPDAGGLYYKKEWLEDPFVTLVKVLEDTPNDMINTDPAKD